MAVMRSVGARVKRVEDPKLITGKGLYTDDVRMMDMLYGFVHRSPVAHARIKSVDISKALRVPGVVAVYTAKEIGEFSAPVPAGANITGMQLTRRYPLVHDGKVRLIGDAIAFVVAESRYAARDGSDAIEVEYDELPVVADMEKAVEPGATKL